jgi:type I restriction enzyme M protein
MFMSERITQSELETYLWGSAVLLRNSIDAGSYKQYIFPLLFFKRICDVYDEECQQILIDFDGDEEALEWPENHRFQVPKGRHWRDVRNTAENVGKAILDAFQAIENANIDKLQGVFGDGSWTNKRRLPDALLKDLIEHFSSKTPLHEKLSRRRTGAGL